MNQTPSGMVAAFIDGLTAHRKEDPFDECEKRFQAFQPDRRAVTADEITAWVEIWLADHVKPASDAAYYGP